MASYKVIGRTGKEIFTDVFVHPSEVLTEELEARKILQKDFASLIGVAPSRLDELLKGKFSFTKTLSQKLEKSLGIDAGFWMRLQVDHDSKISDKQTKTD